MNWILFGFKGSGKTTLGRSIAEQLNCKFIDTDKEIESLYFSRTEQKLTCRAIHQLIGEEGFRSLESETLAALKSCQNAIIAVGGGSILDPTNADTLAKLGKFVYLKISKETLKKRILGAELPSYLNPADPEGSFEKMYNQRKPLYDKILALSIDLETKTQDQAVFEILTLIKKEEAPHGEQ